MGDPNKKEMTDQEMENFDEKRSEAMQAFSEVSGLPLQHSPPPLPPIKGLYEVNYDEAWTQFLGGCFFVSSW